MCVWPGSGHLTAEASPMPVGKEGGNVGLKLEMSLTDKHTLLCSTSYLLGMALEHQVLLTLIQSTFLQSPEMKNSVFSLQQFTQDS